MRLVSWWSVEWSAAQYVDAVDFAFGTNTMTVEHIMGWPLFRQNTCAKQYPEFTSGVCSPRLVWKRVLSLVVSRVKVSGAILS